MVLITQTFPYLSRDMSAEWIIEGKLREKQGETRVSLSLVDARTALVIYTLAQDLDNQPIQLENLCSLCIDEVLRAVRLGDNHQN
jgi:TolB-like protein